MAIIVPLMMSAVTLQGGTDGLGTPGTLGSRFRIPVVA